MAVTTLSETWTAADCITVRAGADLTAGLGIAVALHTTEGQVVAATTDATDPYIGIVVQEPAASAAGTPMLVCTAAGKIVKARVDGNSVNIAIGDTLGFSTGGDLIKTTTNGDRIAGYAMEAATADNVFIKILTCGPGVERAS